MNKFKLHFKITGLELDVEGTKDDVSAITSSLGAQLKDLAQPKGLFGGNGTFDVSHQQIDEEIPAKKLSRRINGKPRTTKEVHVAIDFKNDPTKYGTPTMEWSVLQKSIWILYAVKAQSSASDLTATQIAETFNKHYRQAKTIHPSNVSRDLGKSKLLSKALVGEDTSKNPSTWYLTDEGEKVVQALIANSGKQ